MVEAALKAGMKMATFSLRISVFTIWPRKLLFHPLIPRNSIRGCCISHHFRSAAQGMGQKATLHHFAIHK
jgi:hypothetical protein